MDKELKRKFVKKKFMFAFKSAIITAIVLAAITLIFSLFKSSNFLKNMYMVYFYFGAFSMIVAVPQFYKRNEDAKLRRIRRQSPLFGFYDVQENPYTNEAMEEAFEEFREDGFYTGLSILLFSLTILILGFIFERIYLLRG